MNLKLRICLLGLAGFTGSFWKMPSAGWSRELEKVPQVVTTSGGDTKECFQQVFGQLLNTLSPKGSLIALVDNGPWIVKALYQGKPVLTEFPDTMADKNVIKVLAHHFELEYQANGKSKSLTLILPATHDGQINSELLNKIKKIIPMLPADILSDLPKIRINPHPEPNPNSFLFGELGTSRQEYGSLVVDLYREGYHHKLPVKILETIHHELGHILAYRKYKNTRPDVDWEQAIAADDRSISLYGDSSISEDFAEAVRIYLASNGGVNNPKLLQQYAARFKILDEIMQLDVIAREEVVRELQAKMREKGIYWATEFGVGVAALGLVIYPADAGSLEKRNNR